MPDKKKKGPAPVSPKDAKKGVPASQVRDLDFPDSKTEKVKGGFGKKRAQ